LGNAEKTMIIIISVANTNLALTKLASWNHNTLKIRVSNRRKKAFVTQNLIMDLKSGGAALSFPWDMAEQVTSN
jgi:hypothetical protein